MPKKSVVRYSEYDYERMSSEVRKKGDKRSEFQVDRDRIIHSSAFRRLQAKTQVYGAGLMDFYRTRLTHSIEVSQISKAIAIRLNIDTDLIEAISLAHDIGHPPFGHTGEDKLNELNHKFEGFDANAHNIVILAFLETKIVGKDLSENRGLNLSRATLDGLLKYKTTRDKHRKFLYEYPFFKNMIDWIDERWSDDRNFEDKRSIECQIVNWADTSAYSVHDFEDGIKSGLLKSYFLNDILLGKITHRLKDTINPSEVERIFKRVRKIISDIEKSPTEVQRKAKLKSVTSKFINEFVINTYLEVVDNNSSRYSYRLKVKGPTRAKNKVIRAIEDELIYKSKNILRTRKKCEMIIQKLYEVFSDSSSKNLYPKEYQEYWDYFEASRNDEWRHRLATWYIAGMTDNFAIKTYKEFFDPNTLIDLFISI
ncbi:MAG: dNTP triphosphohydrolase [Spirochaetia bacterium]|nr:dNTP triphosphohydrolase [Spirochaetota bacterium]MCX8097029.1 dNTP triphosphohydrolase [Spirochaetota bacterium]MDW8111776.1 dNTP triphosphohydrolase [Spirochaetia bacterium]